jgi:hypothetical protein
MKFTFATTGGSLYCIDGYSSNINLAIGYLATASIFDSVIPITANSVIYFLINSELNQKESKLNATKTSSKMRKTAKHRVDVDHHSATISTNLSDKSIDHLSPPPTNINSTTAAAATVAKKQDLAKSKRFSYQLVALKVCYLASFCASFVLDFRYIIPDFTTKFYFTRQLLRIANILFQALIPVLSVAFNPNITFKNLKIFK